MCEVQSPASSTFQISHSTFASSPPRASRNAPPGRRPRARCVSDRPPAPGEGRRQKDELRSSVSSTFAIGPVGTKFLLQLANDGPDEIVESPADAIGHLFHSRQPLAELWIHLPPLAAQQGGQFVQC